MKSYTTYLKKLGICCEPTLEATVDRMLKLFNALGCYTKKFYWTSDEDTKLLQEEQELIKKENEILDNLKNDDLHSLDKSNLDKADLIKDSVIKLNSETSDIDKENLKFVSVNNKKYEVVKTENNKNISDLRTNETIDIKTICKILGITPSTISIWRRNDSFPKNLNTNNKSHILFYTQEFHAWIKEKASTIKRFQKYYKTLKRNFKWCEK